ncbi:PAS domain S-box protein [Fidelibacter multiformis]|uniref:PAS domain S-box protein n=1 Tax=Fidelibacter multiformis TaxID=3377529 RepID=UPI0037DC6591
MNNHTKKILLVEDEMLIALHEQMILEDYGYSVLHVPTGEDAIEAVRNTPDIDLILMDINLGDGIDGTDAARQILSEQDIPLVFLSSHTEREVVEKTEGITSYGYIVKNSGETVLIAAIKMAFRLFDAKMREKEKEKRLEHSRNLLHYIIEHSNSAIAVHDRDLRYIYVSKQYLKQYQVKEKDIIGKPHYDVFPDLPEKWRIVHQRALNGEVITSDDDPYIHTDGSIEWTRWECRPWFESDGSIGGIIVYTEVLTRQKKETDALKHGEGRFRLFAELAPVGIVISDQDEKVQYVSPKFMELFGYTMEDMPTADAWFRLAYPDEKLRKEIRHTWKQAMDQARQSGHEMQPLEFPVTCKDGSQKYIEFRMKSSGDLNFIVFIDISERVQAEKALISNEERFRNIIGNMQDIIFTLDTRQRHTGVFGPWVEKMGLSREHFLGKTSEEILGKEAGKVHTEANEKALKGEFVVYEWEIPTDEGVLYYQTSLSPIFKKDGQVHGLVGVGRDITRLILTEKKIKRNEARLESLLRIAHHPAKDIQELLDFALEEAIKLTESEIGYIYFYNETEKKFRLNTWSREVMHQCTVTEKQTVYDLDKTGIWGEAVRQRRPIVVKDFAAPNPQKKGVPEGHAPLHKFLTIPVLYDDEIVAVVGVANKKTDYTDSDIRQLTLMMDTVWKHVKRREVEKELIRAKNELDRYFTLSLDLLCIANTDGQFIRLNPEWEKVLGYPLHELEGRSFLELIHPDDLDSTRKAISTLSDQEDVWNFENRYRCKDGSYRWIEWRSRPSGETIYAVARDVTKRKKAEEKIQTLLREKELLLKETHHRIKNNMGTVKSLLTLQSRSIKDSESQKILQDAAGRVQSMMVLYDKLYRSEGYQELNIRDFLPSLIQEIIGLFPQNKPVKISTDLQNINLDARTLSTIGIILNECITNSMKYAFDKTPEPRISVSSCRQGDKIIILYQDNGKGFKRKPEQDKSQSFGLKLIRMLVEQLNGDLSEEGSQGMKVQISFTPPS